MSLIVVSNRVAAISDKTASAGGLAAALAQGMRKSGGIWFGWSGEFCQAGEERAPKVKSFGNAEVATIDYPEHTFSDFYNGMANGALWPLMHNRVDLMEFTESYLTGYQSINRLMARQLKPFVKPNSIVWVHDYHFLPLANYLREEGVQQPLGFFFHTPFAARSAVECLPHHRELFAALLDYDLIGFQTIDDLIAFQDYAVHDLGSIMIGPKTLRYRQRIVHLGVFPVGIDVEAFADMARKAENSRVSKQVRTSMGDVDMIIGVDRLDYSKGLPQRFSAYERMLGEHPERKNAVTLLQIAPLTRSDVPAYKLLQDQLAGLAGKINGRFSNPTWTPIRYTNESYKPDVLAGFFRMSQACCVTPLRDGMNLVAKEYVAAQDPDTPGALVLSSFAGAARELDAALIVNPYDIDEVADALDQALSMSLAERKDRWESMMRVLRANDVSAWFDGFVAQLKRSASPDRVLIKIA